MVYRGTENYVYNTDALIGCGSSGNVYIGRHKKKGRQCAIKIFRKSSRDVVKNEKEFMNLNHQNIVKFIDLERDTKTGEVAMVMELCGEGSVQCRLQRPEFRHGFQEEEFFNFFKHFCQGFAYLTEHGIYHRDLKPSNILCFRNRDGSIVYKLTDFGSTKELLSENVSNVYGTEEYMHPEVFKSVFLSEERGRVVRVNDELSELWSVGVTLYQVATGKLPFTVPGRREDKSNMYKLISGLPKGRISGCHNEGKFHYKDQLPVTCSLSEGFKTHFVPILQNLFDTSNPRKYSFSDFFQTARTIISFRGYRVFDAFSAKYLLVYQAEDRNFEDLKEEISKQTGIPVWEQVYLVGSRIHAMVVNDDVMGRLREGVREVSLLSTSVAMETVVERWNGEEESLLLHLLSHNLDKDRVEGGDSKVSLKIASKMFLMHQRISLLQEVLKMQQDLSFKLRRALDNFIREVQCMVPKKLMDLKHNIKPGQGEGASNEITRIRDFFHFTSSIQLESAAHSNKDNDFNVPDTIKITQKNKESDHDFNNGEDCDSQCEENVDSTVKKAFSKLNLASDLNLIKSPEIIQNWYTYCLQVHSDFCANKQNTSADHNEKQIQKYKTERIFEKFTQAKTIYELFKSTIFIPSLLEFLKFYQSDIAPRLQWVTACVNRQYVGAPSNTDASHKHLTTVNNLVRDLQNKLAVTSTLSTQFEDILLKLENIGY